MRTFFIALALLSLAPPIFAHDNHPANDDKNCGVALHDDRTMEYVRWSGVCTEGFAEGVGILEWKHGDEPAPHRYEGTLHKGARHGEGYLKDASGTQYEGGFKEGNVHGTGTLLAYWGRYDGSWVDGKRDGKGKMVYTLGGSYDGQWKEDAFHGPGTITYVGGRIVTTEFLEGRPVGKEPEVVRTDKTFRLYESGYSGPPRTKSTVPFSKSYNDMSAEERQGVRDEYVVLDNDDEPPYPANGTKKIYQRIVEAQQLRLARGPLYMHVHIDSQGNPTSVTTYASPDPELTRWVSAVLVTEKYKPGICQGKPCAMRFPIRLMFTADGHD